MLNQEGAMRTIAVCNAKGGAGKTTLALHLAVASVQQGRNVAVVDLDPQLTAVNWSQRRSSRDPVVAVLACAVSQVGAELERVAGLGADVVLIDTPPRAWVGADNAALAAAKLSDLVLLPCRPSILDLEATVTTMQRLQAVTAAPVVVVLNQVPARGRDADEAEAALAGRGVTVAPVRIGARIVFARSLLDGLTAQEVEASGKAADEIHRVHTFCMHAS